MNEKGKRKEKKPAGQLKFMTTVLKYIVLLFVK